MNAVDLFAGAGGWSHGWREATGREPLLAVDHCPHAVHLHRLNHPSTQHFLEDVWQVDPATAIDGRRVDWLHGSPDCTHFSRAKGGKPKAKNIRGLAWVLIEWARVARPRFLSLENVAEFTTWGPLDDAGHPIRAQAGETFQEFVAELRKLGYSVDWRELCAADYGAPTTRRRLFLVARSDGLTVAWPAPTHADRAKRGLFTGTLRPWRAVRECIDWGIPTPSIFTRKKPLASATCRRIAEGVVRFVLHGRPELAVRGGWLVAAFIAQHYSGQIGKPLSAPLPTITTQDHHSLVEVASGGPLGGARKVAAFITSYYSGGGTSSGIDRPLPTIVTHDRHGVVTVALKDGRTMELGDIGMRMLSPRELARAQGFPDSYVLEGTKAEQIARVGNSVVPQLAEAIVRANLGREAAIA